MIVTWYGAGCYKIEASGFNLVSDPQTSARGSRLKTDLILETKLVLPVQIEEAFADQKIIGPGEYEIGPAKIKGVQIASAFETERKEKNEPIQTAYAVLLDGVRFCFLGDIDVDLSESVLEDLGGVDVLFVPVNKRALSYIKIIEPEIIIPGFGDPEKLKVDLALKADPQDKLVIKKKDLENGGRRLVILKS